MISVVFEAAAFTKGKVRGKIGVADIEQMGAADYEESGLPGEF